MTDTIDQDISLLEEVQAGMTSVVSMTSFWGTTKCGCSTFTTIGKLWLARADGVPFVTSLEEVYSRIGRRTIECSRLQELMDSITFGRSL